MPKQRYRNDRKPARDSLTQPVKPVKGMCATDPKGKAKCPTKEGCAAAQPCARLQKQKKS